MKIDIRLVIVMV